MNDLIRKISFAILFSFTGLASYGQKVNPVIQAGTTFQYTFNLHGQTAPYQLTVGRLSDSLTLNWSIRDLAGGTYLIVPKALNAATHLNFAQPQPSAKVVLKEHETFLLISRTQFRNLKRNGQFMYDNTVYQLREAAQSDIVKIGEQVLDVLHVAATDETTEFWILNNPNYPFICQIKGNPLGIDIKLNAIVNR